jgi:hypothetical protein
MGIYWDIFNIVGIYDIFPNNYSWDVDLGYEIR